MELILLPVWLWVFLLQVFRFNFFFKRLQCFKKIISRCRFLSQTEEANVSILSGVISSNSRTARLIFSLSSHLYYARKEIKVLVFNNFLLHVFFYCLLQDWNENYEAAKEEARATRVIRHITLLSDNIKSPASIIAYDGRMWMPLRRHAYLPTWVWPIWSPLYATRLYTWIDDAPSKENLVPRDKSVSPEDTIRSGTLSVSWSDLFREDWSGPR